MKEITLDKLKKILDEKDHLQRIIVDVRTLEEHQESHLLGSVNIPLSEIEHHIDNLNKYKEIYFYCRSGNRCKIACEILQKRGFSEEILIPVIGKKEDWEINHLPVVFQKKQETK